MVDGGGDQMTQLANPQVGLHRIRRVSTAGVAALAGAGFAMSYGALHSLARDSGVPGALAWLWPLVVDGFIVVASLSVLHAVLEARSTAYPWCLLLLFSGISVAGNVAHGAPSPVGRLVAAVPPVALVLAVDLLMRQVHRVLQPQPQSGALSPPLPATSASAGSQPVTAGAPAPLRLAGVTVAERAAGLVARRRSTGQPVTGRWLAGELDVSEGYARRLLRQLDQPAHEADDQVVGGAAAGRAGVGGAR